MHREMIIHLKTLVQTRHQFTRCVLSDRDGATRQQFTRMTSSYQQSWCNKASVYSDDVILLTELLQQGISLFNIRMMSFYRQSWCDKASVYSDDVILPTELVQQGISFLGAYFPTELVQQGINLLG